MPRTKKVVERDFRFTQDWENGTFFEAEFTRNNGERVVGWFRRLDHAQHRQAAADAGQPLSVSERDYKVLRDDKNGEFVVAEFTRDNRDRVTPEFELHAWRVPPESARQDMQRRLSRGFRTYLRPR
jgi:hypothetical protein